MKGFRVVAVERKPTYTLVLYRADRPTFVPMSTLTGLALDGRAAGGAAAAPVSACAADGSRRRRG